MMAWDTLSARVMVVLAAVGLARTRRAIDSANPGTDAVGADLTLAAMMAGSRPAPFCSTSFTRYLTVSESGLDPHGNPQEAKFLMMAWDNPE